MDSSLIAVLLVLVLPVTYLLGHWPQPIPRWLRRLIQALLAVAVLWSIPWQGLDFSRVKHLNLLIAATTAVILLLCHYRVPWIRDRRRRLTILSALAALAVVNYCNFFAFHGHGQRVFIHLHDVAHYYLGSKYYPELGYSDLYTAMLRAEAELHNNHFRATEARDLVTYERVYIARLLRDSAPVKAAFSAERWSDFQVDVDYFRERLGPQYGRVLLDHGFNPTPVWAQWGGALANLVPAGSHTGILVLTLLDPLLLAAAFAAIAWAFGVETLLLSLIYFCALFGATFGWVGGAFLRTPWFFALVTALACMKRRRYGTAGALLAVATSLRVFPVFFFLPLAAKAVSAIWKPGDRDRRAIPERYRRLFLGALVTGMVLAGGTALLPRGLDHWNDFRTNMSRHVANIAPNVVGLTEALTIQRTGSEVTAEEFEQLKTRRQRIRNLQLLVVFLPLFTFAWLAAWRRTDVGAITLALPLLYAGLSLAAYYYVFLVALILAYRHFPGLLALIFTVEAAPYALMLFDDREALLFVYRGLLLAFLYGALALHHKRQPQ